MSDNREAAIDVARAFIDAFNAQDHDALANTLNFPHVRLANGRFVTIEDSTSFVARSRKNAPLLEAEGWDHTALKDVQVVHAGRDKVHMALAIDRCHADGSVYNHFETLWIATCEDGHWGIQFRSSYLITK
jgi:hypothetical protein